MTNYSGLFMNDELSSTVSSAANYVAPVMRSNVSTAVPTPQAPTPSPAGGPVSAAKNIYKGYNMATNPSGVVAGFQGGGLQGALGNLSGFQYGLGGTGGIPTGGFASATGVPAAQTGASTAATTAGVGAGMSAAAAMTGVGALMMTPVILSKLFGDGPSAAKTLSEDLIPDRDTLKPISAVGAGQRAGENIITLADGTEVKASANAELNQYGRKGNTKDMGQLFYDDKTGLIFDMTETTSQKVLDPVTKQPQKRTGTVVGGTKLATAVDVGSQQYVGQILQDKTDTAPTPQPSTQAVEQVTALEQEMAAQGQKPASGELRLGATPRRKRFSEFRKEYEDKQNQGAV